MNAHFPPFTSPGDWITLGAGVSEYGVPVELLDKAIKEGELRCSIAAGARVVSRAELKALRLRLMAERGCRECE